MSSNRQRQPVSYRPFRAEPLLADGLLPVARQGGEGYDDIAQGFHQLAARFGEKIEREDTRRGALEGAQAAIDGRPDVAIDGGKPGAAPAGAAGAMDEDELAKQILRKEEGFRDTPYWDVNALRTGYGSDTVTRADGSFAKVDRNSRVTRQEAELDVARRLRDVEGKRAVDQVGAERWSKLPVAARAALKSVAYNYGSLPPPVVAAARAGNAEAIAGAVERLAANPGRRKNEANFIRRGASAAPSTSAGPVDPATPARFRIGGGGGPTRADTAYGRAYDKSFTQTYLDMTDTELRRTASQVFEIYKDDPAGMETAFTDLKSEFLKKHVFPEIRGTFETGFDRLSLGYLEQGQRRAAEREATADRADFQQKTADLVTGQEQKLASFDPSGASAADMIASDQAAIDAHYDDAVARNVIDADDAVKFKATHRRQSSLAYYGKQAEMADAEGVKAMREEMTRNFADGGIEGLDGEGWQTLDKGLAALEQKKRNDGEAAARKLRDRGDDLAGGVLQGREVNAAELNQLMLDSGKSTTGKAQLEETLAKISAGRAIRDLPLKDGLAYVRGLKQQYGDAPTATQTARLKFAQAALAGKAKAISTDPVSYAEAQGLVEPTPTLSEAGVEDVAGILRARTETADRLVSQLGVAPRFLKAGEAAAIGKMVRETPDVGAALAGEIVAGAGRDVAQVLAEFGTDAPMIAEAGAIMAFDGSPQAAQDVILGYGKGPAGETLTSVKPALATETFRNTTGSAFALQPGNGKRIGRAAAAIARKRISELGIEADSEEAIDVYGRAVHEAAGGVFDRDVQYGGFTTVTGGWLSSAITVLAPSAIRADRFGEVIEAITDEDLAAMGMTPKDAAGKAYPIAQLRQATPVAVAGGYAFAAGDPDGDSPQYLGDGKGGILVLDIAAMRERLEPRTAGAWR